MSSFDGFSMHALTRELDRALSGGRIDKITQPNKQTIILSVRQPGRNFLLHITTNPANPAAHLLAKPLENPPEPPVFCMVLRKQIETGRIASIRQALDEPIQTVLKTIVSILEKTPPELAADIADHGIVLTGGGLLLDSFDRLISQTTGMAAYLCDDPLLCVANGAGKALREMDRLKDSFDDL